MDGFYKEFARRVRSARESAGLTQEAVAKRIGLKRTSVSNIERGTQHIPLHLLYVLASAIGVRPETLLPSEDAPEAVPARVLEALKEQHAEEAQPWVQKIVSGGATAKKGGTDAQSGNTGESVFNGDRDAQLSRTRGGSRKNTGR